MTNLDLLLEGEREALRDLLTDLDLDLEREGDLERPPSDPLPDMTLPSESDMIVNKDASRRARRRYSLASEQCRSVGSM